MMDDNTWEKETPKKSTENVLPQKQIVVAEVSGETYSKKCDKNGVEKWPQM